MLERFVEAVCVCVCVCVFWCDDSMVLLGRVTIAYFVYAMVACTVCEKGSGPRRS